MDKKDVSTGEIIVGDTWAMCMNFNAFWGNRETEMQEYQKQKLKTKLSTFTIISKLWEKSEVNAIKIHIYPEDG